MVYVFLDIWFTWKLGDASIQLFEVTLIAWQVE